MRWTARGARVLLERAVAVALRSGASPFLRKACSNRIVNLAIAALVTLEVSVMVHWDLQFSIHSSSTFYHLLFPDHYHDDHNRRSTSVYHIYDFEEALQVLRTAVLRFYSLPGSSVDLYQIPGPAKMHLALWDTPPVLSEAGELRWEPQLLPTKTFVLEERDPLGPFANGTQAIFHRLVEMDLELHLVSIAREAEDFKSFEWEVHLVWDFSHRGGRIDMFLVSAALPVHAGRPGEHAAPSHGGDLGTSVWLLLCGLSALSLASRLPLGGALRRVVPRSPLGACGCEAQGPLLFPGAVECTRRQAASREASPGPATAAAGGRGGGVGGRGAVAATAAAAAAALAAAEGPPPESAPVPGCLRWPVHRAIRDAAILAFLLLDAAQGRHALERQGMAGGRRAALRRRGGLEQDAGVGLAETLVWLEVRQGVRAVRLLGGVAVFWAWLCVNESSRRSLLSRVMAQAIPPVVTFLLTSLPLFLGFASLGVVLFAEHAPAKFGTLGSSCITLFSLLNGDVLMETMLDVEDAGVLLSRGYVCIFICVFVFMVLNGTLCLIQDSFRLVC